MAVVHGSSIEIDGTAVLLRGAPGSGKSDLALRLLDGGAVLVADDRVVLEAHGDGVAVSPPPAIAGMIELRGVGVLSAPFVARSRLGLVVDLVTHPLPRLPEPSRCPIEGVWLPLVAIAPFEISAAAKIRMIVATLARGGSVASSLGDAC